MSERNYKKALFKLMPRGSIYPREEANTNYKKLLSALAEEHKRLDCEATDLLNEAMPDQTGRFLEDWERVLGLPKCGVQLETREERKNMVLAMLNLGVFSNAQFFENIAAIFGFDATVIELKPFRAGSSSVGDPLNGLEQKGTILIRASCVDSYFFRAGASGAGERLTSCGNEGLECIINFFKHSWQYVVFEFV